MFPTVEHHYLLSALFLILILIIYLLPLSSNNRIRYYGCVLVFCLTVLLVSSLILPVFLVLCKVGNRKKCLWSCYVLKYLTKPMGIKWELRRGEVLREERGAVIVANHQTTLDVLGMWNIWYSVGRCAPVAKKEVFYFWPFGLVCWISGLVFVDRSNSRVAYQQLYKTSRLMHEQKTKLWFFVEGTRNHKMDSLLPFKKGAFRVAIKSQVPIIPVVYSPYYFLKLEEKIFGRGRIIITALDPIPTTGLTEADIDFLSKKTWDLMAKQFELLKKEVLTIEDKGISKSQ